MPMNNTAFRVELLSKLRDHGIVPAHECTRDAGALENDEDDTTIEQLLSARTQRPCWADLPCELLANIGSYLDATRDRIAAMATCCTWRDAVRPYTTTLVFQVPPGQRITIRRAQQHNALVKLAAHHCKGLQGVSFSQYHCLDDASLLALLTRHCVQHLHMPSCTSITDVSIINAGAALRHVRHLTLSNCTRLTDASMQTIATHCQHLQALSICGCSNLTDAGLVAIGKGCSSLQRINLGWCEAVGDAGLTAFAAAVGPRLVDIDLCGCFRITDLGVVWLVWHCPNVVRLDLHCCRRITNASLAAIAEQLHALHFLNLSGCRKISPETVQAVLDANKELHTCHKFRNVILTGGPSLLQVGCPCPRLLRRVPGG